MNCHNNWKDGKCTFECKNQEDPTKYCWNGKIDEDLGEECEDAKDLLCKDCKKISEKPECWNGKQEWEEECDEGENNGKEWINCDSKCKEKEKCENMEKDEWENCDPGDVNKINRWEYWCSNSCQIVNSNLVMCNPNFDWQILKNLLFQKLNLEKMI